MGLMSLMVSHHVAVPADDRRLLAAGGAEVRVVGTAVGVWSSGTESDEPAEEVFCRYTLRSRPPEPGHDEIEATADGFAVSVADPKVWQSALDLADGGSEYARFAGVKTVVAEGRPAQIGHCVVIRPLEAGEVA